MVFGTEGGVLDLPALAENTERTQVRRCLVDRIRGPRDRADSADVAACLVEVSAAAKKVA